jgi:two-component system, NarL family, sensor histidine kinase UhpB
MKVQVPHRRRFASSPRSMAQITARLRTLNTFEKVIIANSGIILLDTLAGWWITQNNPEAYHYLIDTAFIALAVVLGLVINFALLRAAFAPLRAVFTTIRAVEGGDLEARAPENVASDPEVAVLARTFNAMLDHLEQARQDTASRVLRAQEEERRRLALDLHDQTGQSLTALALHAAAIAQRLAGEETQAAAQARREADKLRALAQRTLEEVQALSRQLRPPLLDDLGLLAALRWLAEDVRERLHLTAQVQVRGMSDDSPPDYHSVPAPLALNHPDTSHAGSTPRLEQSSPAHLSSETEIALLRIAQESLTNAARHGKAQRVRLALRRASAEVCLTIADDGVGFDLAHVEPPAQARDAAVRPGLGLDGMRERARLLGGRVWIRSSPGRGCVVRAVIPLSRTDDAVYQDMSVIGAHRRQTG